MKSTDIATFAAALERGATVFDTRSYAQYQQDGLAGSEHLPLEQVQAGSLPSVPPENAVYLICERGQVSELVGLYLEDAGFQHVVNVAGGMVAWRQVYGDRRNREQSSA